MWSDIHWPSRTSKHHIKDPQENPTWPQLSVAGRGVSNRPITQLSEPQCHVTSHSLARPSTQPWTSIAPIPPGYGVPQSYVSWWMVGQAPLRSQHHYQLPPLCHVTLAFIRSRPCLHNNYTWDWVEMQRGVRFTWHTGSVFAESTDCGRGTDLVPLYIVTFSRSNMYPSSNRRYRWAHFILLKWHFSTILPSRSKRYSFCREIRTTFVLHEISSLVRLCILQKVNNFIHLVDTITGALPVSKRV